MLKVNKGGVMSGLTKLSRGWKIAIGLFLGFVLLGAVLPDKQPEQTNAQPLSGGAQKAEVLGSRTESTKAKAPIITKQTVTETQPLPFTSTTVISTSLPQGTTKVTTAGVNGVMTFTYEVTLTDGLETDKKLASQAVTTQPINQVTTIGTYVAPKPVITPAPTTNSSCDPNYSGACVPIASDVDCEGGRGNGPAYVRGPVRVIGVDIYGLDGDNDGVGCES